MEERIRVLGIAPYEGMKTLMYRVANEYPQIDLTLFVGNLEQGLSIAKDNFHGDYDVIISRGGTAQMLQNNLGIPILEIDISMYDILCALKLANGGHGKIAVAAFSKTVNKVRLLCDLMGYAMDGYAVESSDAVEPTLQKLRACHYDAILCDGRTDAIAQRLGLNAFLITSGIDSVRGAFDRAVQLCRSQQHLHDENMFLRKLLRGQIGQTVVLDSKGQLFLSTLDHQQPELLELLRREQAAFSQESERRVIRNLGGMLYVIRIRHISSGNSTYTAFFFTVRKTPLSPNQIGIRFFTRAEAEASYYNSIFNFAGGIKDLAAEINQVNQSSAPIVVTGEDGTGIESVVQALYIQGQQRNAPLISINCGLLNDKSWGFLLEHHNSPLADGGNTLYFASIDALSQERRQQLLTALSEMNVCRRNRVIFSCTCQPGAFISDTGALFLNQLCCLSLYLPPLRQLAERIPTLINLTLNYLNLNSSKQIAGADPEAISLLQSFPWPHNYMQFQRVLGKLVVITTGHMITAESVRTVLQTERYPGPSSPEAADGSTPLDLNRTLHEISRDIAARVLEENRGNQTAAAKRLGISRTTLWRLLRE